MTAEEPMTVGRASLAKAVTGATAAPPGASLLEAYAKWQRSQAGAQRLGKAADAAADLERDAVRKSRKRLSKHLAQGTAPSVACDLAFRQYKLAGGKHRFSDWAVAVGGED